MPKICFQKSSLQRNFIEKFRTILQKYQLQSVRDLSRVKQTKTILGPKTIKVGPFPLTLIKRSCWSWRCSHIPPSLLRPKIEKITGHALAGVLRGTNWGTESSSVKLYRYRTAVLVKTSVEDHDP